MIKKFHEYIKEGFKRLTPISHILSEEELDDQFLRIEEILRCKVSKLLHESRNEYEICIHYGMELMGVENNQSCHHRSRFSFRGMKNSNGLHGYFPGEENLKEEIYKELNQIKLRLESMFPVSVIFPRVPKTEWNTHFGTGFQIIIKLKEI